MKKIFILLFAFLLIVPSADCMGKGETGLSRKAADAVLKDVVGMWKQQQAVKARQNENGQTIVQNGLSMPYSYKIFGQEPRDGRSLYISMHGGGGTTHEVNNQQWDNQKRLYQPAEGVYLAPRAPWDAWNMWFQEPIDSLFEELVRTMVVMHNVNPNKVYLMGYSAGGDGVWRLAPRLADHWAAASMMAGHPGDVSLLNVRNMPFTIWCGALDAAYNRNKEVAARGLELDSLQKADPTGYVHECHIVADKAHWMDLVDAAAVPWMADYRRNPYPKYVVWQQEEVLRPTFYWLKVPRNEMKRGRKIVASIEGNVITLQQCDYPQVTLYLNDQLVNLDKPVKVTYKGRTIFSKKLLRTEDNIRSSLAERGDPSYAFPAQLTVNL